MPRVLVIDDDETLLFLIERALEGRVSEVVTAQSAGEGLESVRGGGFDVVLLDLKLPDAFGLDILQNIRALDARLPVIAMTADADSSSAISAVQRGAYDYIAKPIEFQALVALVEKAAHFYKLMNRPVALGLGDEDEFRADTFVGTSPAMLEVFKAIGRSAVQNIPVLIRGESGAGKELVARAIYQHSKRADAPYMAINCAALPDTLLESELFGHEKGSFTGADRRRIGKFEQCTGGTIFLDEIGDMPLDIQAKVLRLLQDQKFERVGGNQTIETDVRIVAATNQPLEELVEAGEFRSDLLYRLNGVTIQIPALRERRADLPALVQYFLRRAIYDMNRHDIQGIGPEALEVIEHYAWPGNVRELQSAIRHAVLSANGPAIAAEHLPEEVVNRTSRRSEQVSHTPPAEPVEHSESSHTPNERLDHLRHVSTATLPKTVGGDVEDHTARSVDESMLSNDVDVPQKFDVEGFVRERLQGESNNVYAEVIEEVERIIFQLTLEHTSGNQSKASQRLGITRAKVRDRIASYGITIERRLYE